MTRSMNALDMPHLRFDFDEVAALVAHARASDKRMPGQPKGTDLLLVGDSGVYLMSAGRPSPTAEDGKSQHVVYAKGCNPTVDPFDSWWGLKEDTFGGDDGADPISVEDLFDKATAQKGGKREFVIGFTDTSLVIEVHVAKG